MFQHNGLENIQDMSVPELLNNLDKVGLSKGNEQFSSIDLNKICLKLFGMLGLQLDNQQIQMVTCDVKETLTEATAGSGKTTMGQAHILREKIFRGIPGYKCLSLAYNDQACKDMEKRHRQMCDTIISKRIGGVNIDNNVIAKTFHSNAITWIKEYADDCGIKDTEKFLLDTSDSMMGMRKAIQVTYQKNNINKKIDGRVAKNYKSLNDYVVEKMIKPEGYPEVDFFRQLGDSVEVARSVLSRYTMWKELNSRMDYCDTLTKFHKLLQDREDIRERVQNAYHIVLLDEYQDITELMNEILKYMIGPKTKLICIGDGDQAIYGFRGTNSTNCLRFTSYFPNGKVLTMGKNRRCPEKVLDVAKSIIKTNELRLDKDIYTDKKGGEVHNIEYASNKDEVRKLIEVLKTKTPQELNRTCIAYRNRESSCMVTLALLLNDIPFYVDSGYSPYTDKLTRCVEDIMMMLRYPWKKYHIGKALPMVLPMLKRDDVERILKTCVDGTTFTDMDWSEFNKVNGFSAKMDILKKCSECCRNKNPMRQYFPTIFGLFKCHYWDFVRKSIGFNKDFEEDIIHSYMTDKSYDDFIEEKGKMAKKLREYHARKQGIKCTTFHSLKGLEFEEVHLIDLDEDIFPNFKKIDEGDITPEEKQDLKEECVRLFYVAMTRSKDKLYMYWNRNNPSAFKYVVDNTLAKARIKPVEKIETILDEDNLLDLTDLDGVETPTIEEQCSKVEQVIEERVEVATPEQSHVTVTLQGTTSEEKEQINKVMSILKGFSRV